MAKWAGKIGFVVTENHDGIWSETAVEKPYTGDLLKDQVNIQNSDKLNDNFILDNKISVVANKFAFDNFQYMRYVTVMGTKWKVRSAEIQYPRVILSVGGVYNGEQEQD